MVDFLLGVGVLICVYGITSISLNLQLGVTELINFGQVAFVGIGAYSVAICAQHGLPWPLGFAIGAVLAALAGMAVGRLGRTLASDYWAIVTLALAELIRLVALNEDGLTGGPQGISNVPGLWGSLNGTQATAATLATAAVLLFAAFLIGRALVRSQFGRVLRTVRENPDLAATLGHNVVSSKVRILGVSAAMAAVSGGFYAMYISYVGPTQLVPFETFLVFTMVVVGGLGSIYGALVGSVLILTLYDSSRFLRSVTDLSADQAASVRILAVGAVLLVFLLTRTNGIFPERMRKFDA